MLLPLELVVGVGFVSGLGAALAALACFFASRARRLRSANLLPEAKRPGCFAVAGTVFGTSEVMCVLVVVGAVSSGIVSSCGVSII